MARFRLTIELDDGSSYEYSGDNSRDLFSQYGTTYKDQLTYIELVEINDDNAVVLFIDNYDSIAAMVYEAALHDVVEVLIDGSVDEADKIQRLIAMFGL